MSFLKDVAKQGAEAVQAKREEKVGERAVVAAAIGTCPDADRHYEAEVNKGSLNMGSWQSTLSKRYRAGYRLAHVFEQDKNTVMVWEHHFHS